MGRKFRKFLLAVTSWCPPLRRWLRRYFLEHPEYEFRLEREKDGARFGCYYCDTHTTEIFLSEIRSASPKRFFNEVLRTIEHEDIHHALFRLGAYEDIVRSLARWGFRCFPSIPVIRGVEEELVQLLERESLRHCHDPHLKRHHQPEYEGSATPNLRSPFYVA